LIWYDARAKHSEPGANPEVRGTFLPSQECSGKPNPAKGQMLNDY